MLTALRQLTGGAIQLWRREGDRVRALAGEPGAWWPTLRGENGHALETPGGAAWLEPLPAVPGTWLQLGPDQTSEATRAARARAAAAVCADALAYERETAMMAAEIATRYEEIDLLYTINEILGHTVRLEEAAQKIVREVSDVVGARRASIMVYDEAAGELRVVAGRGLDGAELSPVPVNDALSIAARAFRERTVLSFDAADAAARPGGAAGRSYRGQSFLSVPILYAPPGDTPRPIGVINLTDRLGQDAFTAGHKKLVTAIASQIGAAIENARLVEGERKQARLSTELALAHNLQVVLLPPASLLVKAGDIGVRCQPAESLGGDFYDVIPLGGDAVGVMIGDVSGHGFAAALLMAHAISAAALLAQSVESPEDALARLLELVGDELARAEMFMSIVYGVVDARRSVFRYANAGHPHAFIVPAGGGRPRRLRATAPPLGLAEDREIGGATVPWSVGQDLLCLFTDGLIEARDAEGRRYGEPRLLGVVGRHHAASAAGIVAEVFRDLDTFASGEVADDRTLLLLRR